MLRIFLSTLFMFIAVATLGGAPVSYAHITEEEPQAAPEKKPPVVLTLAEALSLTAKNSPRLKIAGLGIEVADAEVTQASLIPNPELSYESENFDGSGLYKGGALAEDTVSLSQQLEIGGKRGDRIRVAETDASAARIDNELIRFAVVSEVVSRFVNALANQLRLQTAQALFEITENLTTATAARVEAGKEPPFYAMNANAALFASKADYERAKNEFILSRRRLATLWGAEALAFNRLSGNIESFTQPPQDEEVMQGIARYPQARRNGLIVANADARAELQAARRWPDVTVSIGERQFRAIDERSYVGSVAVAIPLFDRNQGAHRAARIEALQAEELSRRADLNFRLAIESALGNLWTAYHELESFRQAGLSAMTEAMEAATEGYREGKLSYVEALNARQAFADAQSRYIDALERYHILRARLDELTGQETARAGFWLLLGRSE